MLKHLGSGKFGVWNSMFVGMHSVEDSRDCLSQTRRLDTWFDDIRSVVFNVEDLNNSERCLRINNGV